MDKAPKKTKAVIYTRVSSSRQVDNYSLATQEDICKDFCLKHLKEDVPEERIFREEGESAKTADRTQLKKMLEYCSKNRKEIGYVVVYKVDRFSRSVNDFSALKLVLAKLDIKLLSATEPIGENSNSSVLMENMLACFAQFDNDNRGERAKNGLRDAAMDGCWTNRAPIGYENCKNEFKEATLKIDENLRLPLKKFFETFAKGYYMQSEAAKLAKECGIVMKSGKPISKNGAIKLLNRAEVYAGYICNKSTNNEMVKGIHPAIISEETYKAVKAALKGRKRKQHDIKVPKYQTLNSAYPLRRLLVCSNCGKPLTASAPKGKSGKRYPQYHCTHCTKKKDKVVIKVPVEDAHEQFQELLKRYEMAPYLVGVFRKIVLKRWNEDFKEAINNLRNTNEQISTLKERKANLVDLVADGEMKPEVCNERIAEYNAKIADLEADQKALKSVEECKEKIVDNAVGFLSDLVKTWDNLSIENRVKFQIAMFPNQIVVSAKGKFGTPKVSPILEEATEIKKVSDKNGNNPEAIEHTMAEGGRFELPLQVSPD